jgi:lysophospholipase L1-like esterase
MTLTSGGIQAAGAATAATTTAPFNECPAIGDDTGCALLIDITNNGTQVIGDPTQGPYDGSDDTLVGVLNQSSKAVNDVPLSSSTENIFGFDGDEICAGDYGTWGSAAASSTVSSDTGSAGCPYDGDTTTAAGPDTSFSNISADQMSGDVNFVTPLAPGQSTYFSLEEALATSPPYNVQIGNGITRYVALGDSYSSGEGNPPFITGSDSSTDHCDRSSAAYGPLVAADESVSSSNFVFAACSGAVLADMFLDNFANGEQSQLNSIAATGQTSPTTDLVTLSIGGNDAGFEPIIQSCLSYFTHSDSGCSSAITSNLNQGIDALVGGETVLYNTSNGTYADCNQACVNEFNFFSHFGLERGHSLVAIPGLIGLYQAIEARAPNAAIRVVLYPHLFPSNPTSSCVVGSTQIFGHIFNVDMSASNMEALNNASDFLDSAIANQVLLAQQQGIPVSAVDPRTDFSAGHEICSTSNIAAQGTGSWLNPLLFSSALNPSDYSFHPNSLGQADFASLVEASL